MKTLETFITINSKINVVTKASAVRETAALRAHDSQITPTKPCVTASGTYTASRGWALTRGTQQTRVSRLFQIIANPGEGSHTQTLTQGGNHTAI
ncbi:hypothetical protein RRG08_021433 [Elysia crispata]|uniref:Uncharacterized protein n=1 Tax=Elysia crispata TaxID=231223 RepID=A0AAE1DT66_9GAST|nr:hypothetical protein RRG08_021433 [Elysia crispata]